MRTPEVLPAPDGREIVVGRHRDGEQRHAVLFEWLPGSEPARGPAGRGLRRALGAITARMHRHARGWAPAGRLHPADLGLRALASAPAGHWGRWQDGMGVGAAELARSARLDRRLRDAAAPRSATGPDRFGLIHADMRLANLLVDGGPVSVIDFDDCGFGWFMYDLGSSSAFIEHYPRVPELIDAWVRGYRERRAADREDEAEMPTFVLLRRLLLVAWIGSHRYADAGPELGAEYTQGQLRPGRGLPVDHRCPTSP